MLMSPMSSLGSTDSLHRVCALRENRHLFYGFKQAKKHACLLTTWQGCSAHGGGDNSPASINHNLHPRTILSLLGALETRLLQGSAK